MKECAAFVPLPTDVETAELMLKLGWAWMEQHAPTRLTIYRWQPIESAPKDGREILGYRHDCGVLIIRWTSPSEFCTDAELADIGMESAEKEDWFCADFIAGQRLEDDETPTHWMPLPEAPK